MKKVYEYFDYRDFLRDHYEESKREKPFFSYRYITQKTGIDSSFYLKIINKQKHLSTKTLENVIEFLVLKKREEQYFRTLYHYSKARQADQIRYYFEELLSLRETRIKTLDKSYYDYFSSWYNIPLRELLNVYNFKQDHEALGRQLQPGISALEAKRSIALLKRLRLIKKDELGYWRPSEPLVSSGENRHEKAIENFQREILGISSQALDNLLPNQRDISTLTISTSRQCMKLIQDRLQRVRKEILELVQSEQEVDGVYQINFMSFAISKQQDGSQ